MLLQLNRKKRLLRRGSEIISGRRMPCCGRRGYRRRFGRTLLPIRSSLLIARRMSMWGRLLLGPCSLARGLDGINFEFLAAIVIGISPMISLQKCLVLFAVRNSFLLAFIQRIMVIEFLTPRHVGISRPTTCTFTSLLRIELMHFGITIDDGSCCVMVTSNPFRSTISMTRTLKVFAIFFCIPMRLNHLSPREVLVRPIVIRLRVLRLISRAVLELRELRRVPRLREL
mmetsp:Transcript_63007/g.142178  ORF Transcript_63007/g.142178 Transcript_63007/m.142178 type:complete len:228 (+) Transcript_63007:735-1418(+)